MRNSQILDNHNFDRMSFLPILSEGLAEMTSGTSGTAKKSASSDKGVIHCWHYEIIEDDLASNLSLFGHKTTCTLSFKVRSTNSTFKCRAILLVAGLLDCENTQNYTESDSETMNTTIKTICKAMFSI